MSKGTLLLYINQIATFVRNGNTTFVLQGSQLGTSDTSRDTTLLINAASCPEELCATLAFARAGQYASFEYIEGQDAGRVVRLYESVTLDRYPS